MDIPSLCSPHQTTGGMVYFARMLSKIRLHAAGQLPVPYHEYLGGGFDGRCCHVLGVDYAALRDHTLRGGTDAEILEWCFQAGRRLNDVDVLLWNGFATKRGWRDDAATTERLQAFKEEAGLGDRADIVTFFDFYEADEGRG